MRREKKPKDQNDLLPEEELKALLASTRASFVSASKLSDEDADQFILTYKVMHSFTDGQTITWLKGFIPES